MKRLPLISFICGLILLLQTLLLYLPYPSIVSRIFDNSPLIGLINLTVVFLSIPLALIFGVIALLEKPKGRDLVFAILGIAFVLFYIVSSILTIYSAPPT